jgi:hypothetical protein
MVQREELEAKIREKRLAEATKKGLTGAAGKIGTVLRMMGETITGQSDMALGSNPRGAEEESNDMPVMYMDGVERPTGREWADLESPLVDFGTYEIGRHFDGLGRGMHMEIFYKEDSSEMSVYYRGHLVYRESQGELVCYIPNEEWEGWISSLFKVAKKAQREEKEVEFQSKVKEAERSKQSWLRDIASRWGLT